ncbi:hypothetical protein NXH67_07445 [Butyrivibrio sp. DSM 10294]|uniref:hypothetical protein n=1 Tax=Butyrivibrio sp. DSM 10294 TaxID=2972457 RepID=UPI00234E7CE8|nr:hypothetical protein [Butyrivibrio sp. DSM 10294]MDC7293346.1 hypothetical protein [Butyrivibrio sp. DSM 10294]
MPHSSGGGHCGGGCHMGSSGSSARSHYDRSHGRVFGSRKPFANSNRYVYYRHGQPHYYYNTNPSNFRSLLMFTLPFLIGTFIGIIYGAFLIFSIINGKSSILPVPGASVQIVDNYDAVSEQDEQELSRVLNEFMDITNIVPVVVTCSNDEWQSDYSSLTKYAYDYYVDRYSDEKHWVIIYSADKNVRFSDWYFEGMQGDNTDSVLSPGITRDFNNSLYDKLMESEEYTTGRAFAEAFEELNGRLTSPEYKRAKIVETWILIVIFTAIFAVMLFLTIRIKYESTAKICVISEEGRPDVYNVKTGSY